MKILHSTNAEEGKNGKKPIIFPFKKAKPGGMRWAPRATLRWPRRLAECTGAWRNAVAAGGMHELLGLYRSSTSV